MGGERLKRILLVVAAGVFLLLASKALADWQATKAAKGESLKLPSVTAKLEEVGAGVLGKAVEVLPGSPQLPAAPTVQAETTKVVEKQTSEIIEIIKQLPQSQLDQIKKQIFKNFCREVLGE